MKFSTQFIKTKRDVSEKLESKNAKFLTQAGYVHQELAGVYSYLLLGLIVLNKIENIVRKHMNEIASELQMSSLQPKDNWVKTGRIDSVDVLFKAIGANKLSAEKNSTEYILGSTHEEIIVPLLSEYYKSYRDFPATVYQIQWKFRNEARAKSGLMRGREFLMKDLYSLHTSKEGFSLFYELVKKKYFDIFNELGIGKDTFATLASGGDFTPDFSHEFQLVLESGEDTIYVDEENNIAYNEELNTDKDKTKIGFDISKLKSVKASEIGNIFPLENKYSNAFDYYFTDSDNTKKPLWAGCYGIGISRLMGCIAEKFATEKGLKWPDNLAPFKYHLISITKDVDSEVYKRAEEFYNHNPQQVLWDDRLGLGFGEKMADAELIGCSNIVIISPKTIEKGVDEVIWNGIKA